MTAAPSDAAAVPDTSLSGAFRIDREGLWHHEGVEVTHPGVLRNLYANLRADGETHHLQLVRGASRYRSTTPRSSWSARRPGPTRRR
jgi:hypothetical protein